MTVEILWFFISSLQALGRLELFRSDWTAFACLISCLVAYFGLMKCLAECLDELPDTAAGTTARHRLELITHMSTVLRPLSILSAVVLCAHLVNMFSPILTTTIPSSYRQLVVATINVWTPLNFIFLSAAGYMVGVAVYAFKQGDAENACRMWEAVIHLRCGRKLTGFIGDLSFLTRTSYHLGLCRMDMTVDVVSLAEVAAIFLQPEYEASDVIKGLDFVEGRHTLYLETPHREELPGIGRYDSSRFVVLDLVKPSTNSRYAIISSDCYGPPSD